MVLHLHRYPGTEEVREKKEITCFRCKKVGTNQVNMKTNAKDLRREEVT